MFSPSPVRAAWAAALAVSLGGCSSWDVRGPEVLPAPTELRAQVVSSAVPSLPWELDLAWTPPAIDRDPLSQSVTIEVLRADGTLVFKLNTFFGADHTSEFLPTDVADGQRLLVQAYATYAGRTSPRTAPVAVDVGVRAPTWLRVAGNTWSPLTLTWDRTSPNATGVLLERRLVPVSGVPGPWERLPVTDPLVTSYVDDDTAAWRDGAVLGYRVSHVVGSIASAAVEASAGAGRPLEPVLTASADGTGAHLALAYPGAEMVGLFVWRQTDRDPNPVYLADLPPGVTAFDDPVPPSFYRYLVAAHADVPGMPPWIGALTSAQVPADVFVPSPAWAAALTVSFPSLPAAVRAARDSAGRFALLAPPGEVLVPEGGGFASWAVPPMSSSGTIAYDPADRLHFFYEAQPAFPAWTLLHRWREGGAWQEDTVASGAELLGSWSGTVDSAGDPHVAWQLYPGISSAPTPITWAVRRAGAWTNETLPAPASGYRLEAGPAVDPAGQPALIATPDDATQYLLRRDAAGWTSEALPAGTGVGGMGGWEEFLFRPAVDRTIVRAIGTGGFWIREETAAGWLDPEQAVPGTAPSWGAISPDGARLAVATGGDQATLAVRAGTTWKSYPLAATSARMAVGFTSAGKFWVLSGLLNAFTPYGAPTFGYVLYEEP